MQQLADSLDVEIDPKVWPSLVDGASLASMRSAAAERAPNQGSVLKDAAKFFRRGTPGAGREVLDDATVAAYERRVGELVAAEDVDDQDGVRRLLNLG